MPRILGMPSLITNHRREWKHAARAIRWFLMVIPMVIPMVM
ncbi:hypothetical protein [Ostreibacterium oceani]|nr:hypothetical protein [Ostreibacterium oceani]